MASSIRAASPVPMTLEEAVVPAPKSVSLVSVTEAEVVEVVMVSSVDVAIDEEADSYFVHPVLFEVWVEVAVASAPPAHDVWARV